MPRRRPALLGLYSTLTRALAPLAWRRVQRKLAANGADPARISERLGRTALPRPAGRLIWFHAASVGESVSVLRLIDHLGQSDPNLRFLITSGTATSADVLARRLPKRTQHQFAPLDTREALRRFLAHWHPDLGVFVESELWPHMIEMAYAHDVPLALINARISDRSARGWKRFGRTARYLLSHFSIIHCQDQRTADHFHDLGLRRARAGGNLKAAAGALPYDAAVLTRLRGVIGTRPLWVASSTHPGEEETVLAAHAEILKSRPDALLILVPRHPERAREILEKGTAVIPTWSRRSTDMPISAKTQVYLADTMGETGLWYALAPIVFLGGSLTPVGGHNPYEPAAAGAAVLHGPLYANFTEAYAAFDTHGGALEVADAGALSEAVLGLMSDSQALDTMRENARSFAQSQTQILDEIGAALLSLLATGRRR